MKSLFRLFLLVTCLVIAPISAFAGANDPLFINMTTEDSHRANMAIGFGKAQLERGHPLTIFINDHGVLVASKTNAQKYPEQQKAIAEILRSGGVVLICPTCMKKFGIKPTDLLPGTQVGNPDLTGTQLFKDNTKTLTW